MKNNIDEQERILDVYSNRDQQIDLSYFGFENLAHFLRVQQRYQKTMHLLREHGYSSIYKAKILDLGCGNGIMMRNFIEWGAQIENISGLDLRPGAVKFAKHLNPNLDIIAGSATKLPWGNQSFDIVCQHTMFTSIMDMDMKKQIAKEMTRVLKKDGIILWYDYFFDNPKNKDVRGVKAAEISKLFPEYDIDLQKITLAPPIARRIPDILLPTLYPLLSSISFLRTHYLGVFTKK